MDDNPKNKAILSEFLLKPYDDRDFRIPLYSRDSLKVEVVRRGTKAVQEPIVMAIYLPTGRVLRKGSERDAFGELVPHYEYKYAGIEIS